MRHGIVLALLMSVGAQTSVRAAGMRAPGLCGDIVLQGRRLPSGFVSLVRDFRPWAGKDAGGRGKPAPGDSGRGMIPIKNGRFCIRAVTAGNYRLIVTPPFVLPPFLSKAYPVMAVSYRGTQEPISAYRLTLDTEGSASVYDRGGQLISHGSLPPMEVMDPDLSEEWIHLRGDVRFPDRYAAGDLPLLSVLSKKNRPGSTELITSQHYTWLDLPGTKGSSAFDLKISPGRLFNLFVRAKGVTSVELRIPQGGMNALSSSGLTLILGPSASLRGRVTIPDGNPFRPEVEEGLGRTSLFAIKTASFWDEFISADGIYADEHGRLSMDHLSPGFKRIIPLRYGGAFPWSLGPPRSVWIEAGQRLQSDWRLSEEAEVIVDPKGDFPEPFQNVFVPDIYPLWLANERERWIVGLPAGPLDETSIRRLLFSDDAPFSFIQDSAGAWLPRFRAPAGPSLASFVSPGRYDVYLLEMTHRYKNPSVRILAISKNMKIRSGQTRRIRFKPSQWRPGGSAVLSGSIKAVRTASIKEIKKTQSVGQIHGLLSPAIHLYGPKGELVAAGFLPVSYDRMGDIIRAAGRGQEEVVVELQDHWPRVFSVDGLAPGRYRARVTAHGYKARRLKVDLLPRTPFELDLDLEKY